MLDEKKVEEIKRKVEKFLDEGAIIRNDKKSIQFFLTNSKNSLDSAKLLFEASTNNKMSEVFGFKNFNGYLWVINASYYSMFYTARALLENAGVGFNTDYSIHEVVFDALVYYFYRTGKLEKKFIEDFAEAGQETSDLLGRQKAKNLMESYYLEKSKGAKLTYETGEAVIKGKAETSLKRAIQFNMEIRKILEIK